MSNSAQTLSRSALALAQQGRLAEAAALFQQALQLRPDDAESLSNLGNIYFLQGNTNAAIPCYQQALQIRPQFGDAHYNIAVALQRQNLIDDALDHYRRAVEIAPQHLDARNNLGNILKERGQFDEAITCYQQVLQLKPDFAEVHLNLGIAYSELQQWEQAIACYQKALGLNPRYVQAHTTLGIALAKLGRSDEALRWYDRALVLQPDSAEARWNRAILLLQRGDFARGWPEYEWRWAEHPFAKRHFSQPLWDGSDLQGRTILIHAEQGLGDTIQFIRFLPMVKQRGGRTIVECQRQLVGLLTAAPGIDRLLPRETPLPSFDVHAPLLSLPGIFRTTLDSIPSTVPYVAVDNSLVKHWQEVLADLADKSTPNGRSIRVGIAWQGSRTNIHDRQRSFALSHFTRLAEISGVQLISLQQGWGAEQLRDPDLPFQVTELPSREGEELLPFAHVAAVMKNLDLIISCDSANAHLAGALGVPVWIALSFGCDWRWLLRREDNPWYPTARLFRQSRRGAWEEVFERMAQQLGLVTPR